jgi:carboxypeptidase Q
MKRSISFAFSLLLGLAATGFASDESVDLDAVTKIRDQGFRHSQVMDLAWHLTEGVGPRLTGSPQ